MKKFIISLLVFTCVLLNIAPLFNVNVFAHSDEESGTVSYCASASDSINFDSGNSNVFSPGETISFTYTVRSEYDIVDVSGEAIGFDVIRLEANEEKRIYVTLACDSSIEVGSLMISVQLSNGEVLSTNIYGLNNMYGTFISYYEEGALNEYLNYMQTKGYLPKSKCISIKEKYTNQYVTNTYRSMSHAEFNSMYSNSMMQNISNDFETISSPYAWSGGSGDTEIVVYVRWKDSLGVLHGLRGVKVEIYDDETVGSDELLASFVSNDDGMVRYYTDNNDGLFQKGYDIYVKIYAEDGNVTVVDNSNILYNYNGFDKTKEDIKDGQFHLIEIQFERGTTDVNKAFVITQSVFTARDFARSKMGYTPDSVIVKYPSTEFENSCYEFDSSTIYLKDTGNDTGCGIYESWDLITHEYGHHIQKILDLTDAPDQPIHLPDVNHAVNLHDKEAGIKLAWGEAWPTIFGMVAQDYDLFSGEIPYTLDGRYTDSQTDMPIESSNKRLGEACEASVMAVLWDIFDSGDSESLDSISTTHTAWWNLTTQAKSWTFDEFVTYYHSIYSSMEDRIKLGRLLQYYGMAPYVLTEPFHINRFFGDFPGDGNEYNNNQTTHSLCFDPGGDGSIVINGTTISFENNIIDILIYDDNMNLLFSKNEQPATGEYYFTDAEWNSLLTSLKESETQSIKFLLKGKNTAQGYTTGYYYSDICTIEIPEAFLDALSEDLI